MNDTLPAAAKRALVRLIHVAMDEDLAGSGDVTTASVVDEDAQARGQLIAKESMVVAGLAAADVVFAEYDSSLQWLPTVRDGDAVSDRTVLARIEGPAASLLAAERVALNIMQRLSGVATLTRQFVEAAAGHDVRIVDTRKTTAGWRALQKWAVRVGGGHNHRMSLADGVLIKDNHIAAAGSITTAVERARANAHHLLKIEVEVVDMPGVREALAAGADVLLLDNMSAAAMREAVALVKEQGGGRVRCEASGNITLERVAEVAATGVDIISSGALTHSARGMDISLDFVVE